MQQKHFRCNPNACPNWRGPQVACTQNVPNCCFTSVLFRSKFLSMSDILLSHAPSPPILLLHTQPGHWWRLHVVFNRPETTTMCSQARTHRPPLQERLLTAYLEAGPCTGGSASSLPANSNKPNLRLIRMQKKTKQAISHTRRAICMQL